MNICLDLNSVFSDQDSVYYRNEIQSIQHLTQGWLYQSVESIKKNVQLKFWMRYIHMSLSIYISVCRHRCFYIPRVPPTLIQLHCAIFLSPSGHVAAAPCDEFRLVCSCQMYCEKPLWGFNFQDIELVKPNWEQKAEEYIRSSSHQERGTLRSV